MSLEEEIQSASKKVVKDGYDMSIGEIINLYRDKELIINPKYQRYFRWDPSQKTKFIESLLLGIPIPPIFVYTTRGRTWELVDGLQRIATILEFVGILRDNEDPEGKNYLAPSTLEGTTLLPSLHGKRWEPSSEDADDGIGDDVQFDLKRVRVRVEILKKESDPMAKYELFQRLNSGGSILSEQEVRSCVIIMINEQFHDWLIELSKFSAFQRTIDQTERAEKRQRPLEYVIRLLAFRNCPYQGKLDVHEYLDKACIDMSSTLRVERVGEKTIFEQVFSAIDQTLGNNAFKKWENDRFIGQSSLAAYETCTYGLSKNWLSIDALAPDEKASFISRKMRELWSQETFRDNSKAGVRGTTRLTNLLPFAIQFFKP